MTVPQWSPDNPFADQQPTSGADQWSSDNPFADREATATAAPTQPQLADQGIVSKVWDFGKGVLSGAKNVAVGTAHFVYDGFSYPFRGPTAEELQNPMYRANLQRYGLDPNKVQPVRNQAEEVQRAKDLAKGATIGLVEATFEGGKKALSPSSTPFQRGEGTVEGIAGVAGIHGLVKPFLPGKAPGGPIERIEKRQNAPVEPPPQGPAGLSGQKELIPEGTTDFSKANTPEERQAIVERLKAQAAETEAKQAADKIQLIRAVQTWNTLSVEQRQSIVPGLAVTDYAKGWKELSKDAKTAVRKAFPAQTPVSGTNLDTSLAPEGSQVSSSGPAGQGEGALAEVPRQPAGPSTAEASAGGEVARAPELGKALSHSDVVEMDINELRSEMLRAEGKLDEITRREAEGPSTKQGLAPEREFWEKYSEDLKNEQARRLYGPPRESIGGQALFDKIDQMPDIAPAPDVPQEMPGSWLNTVAEMREEGPMTVEARDQMAADIKAVNEVTKPQGVAGAEHLGKRFTNPERPEYSAVITKNTKPGEKPYRVSYFKKNADGEAVTYLHNHFDTPQQAYDWVTGKAEMAGDKLKGYVERPAAQKDFKPEQFDNGEGETIILSKNTIQGEGPYRITVLSDGEVSGHMAFDTIAEAREAFEKHKGLTEPTTEAPNPNAPSSPEPKQVVSEATPEAPPPGAEGTLKLTAQQLIEKLDEKESTSWRIAQDKSLSSAEKNKQWEQNRQEVNKLIPPEVLDAIDKDLSNQFDWPDQQANAILKYKNWSDLWPVSDESRSVIQNWRDSLVPPEQGLSGPVGNTLGEVKDNLASEQIIKETSGRRQDKPMGQLSLDELYEALAEAKERQKQRPEWMGTQDAIDALEELIVEKGGEVPSKVEPLDPLRMEKIEQSIEDKTQVEKLLDESTGPTTEFDKLSLAELDDALDFLDNQLETGEITERAYEQALYDIADAKKSLKAKELTKSIAQPPTKFKMPDTLGKDLNKFSNDQLSNVKKSIGALLRSPDVAKLPEANILRQELDRIFDYEAQVRKQSEGPAGPGLSIKKIEVEGRPPFEQYFAKKIVLEPDFKSPINFVKKLRQAYQGIVRPSHAANVADRLYEGATGEKLAAHKATGKQMEMMDGSMTQAETFLRGDGPFIPDGNGGFVKTGAKSLADIVVNTAKGQVERLGWLWAARRALELKALRNKNIGIDLGYAQELVVNSSREMHVAVDEARAYHSALSQFGVVEGLISPEARAAFEAETSYGPIQRLYGPQEIVSKVAERVNTTGKPVEQIMASDEFKRLKGSDLLIRNMVESTIDVTHRILRAAKINRILLTLVDKAVEQPELYKGIIDRLEHREHLQVMRDITARASAVKALFKESGVDISAEHANLFANLLSDNAMEMKNGIARVWRNGKIEAWKVDELTANSLKSLTPSELATWVKVMGAPARVARLGIVLDPMFMAGQLLNDQFQGWFNTRYGFTPVLDTFRGWYNIVHNTEAFKEALRAGGLEKSALRGRTTLGDIIAGPALTPGELAFQQIKTAHPFKALQTIITPIREATRMGEYLKARGHGATPMEAAWAARDLLGNYSLQGTFATVRALNYMSLFLGPAIAVTDKTARTIRERPGQWFSRATTLAAISTLLYMANEDDEEIKQLRQTPGGQRWWFFRVGNEIMKVRKPYFEGAVFASGAEAFLDQMTNENPEAMSLWMDAQRQELTLNMLPVMGVLPVQLWANKDFHSGAPIIPEGQEGLDPQFQTGYYSGSADRLVGKATGISPAILSYVVRGTTGYLGESAVKGVSAAIDWSNTGELPPIEDLPLTQRAFAKYPSYSVKPVRDFYKMAEEVGQAAKTIDFAAQHSPDDLETVLLAHEKEMPLIELFNDARTQIADLRRAITSIEDLKDLGPASKKLYTDEYLRTIIEISKATVDVARAMQEGQE